MKPSEHIFFLVKSLTKTEKAYFKKFVTRQGDDSNYALLFDAIEAQKEYDEKALVKKFSGTKLSTQIHVYKNYLYKLILKALHNYYAGSTATSRILEQMHYAEILEVRGLFLQSAKIVKQVKEEAAKFEKEELLLDIVKKEWDMFMGAEEFDKESENYIRKLYEERKQYLAKLQQANEYSLYSSLFRIHKRTKGMYNLTRDLDLFHNKLQLPEVDEKALASFESKRIYYFSCHQYYDAQSDFAKSLEYLKKILALFAKHPYQVEENLQFYIFCLFAASAKAENCNDEKSYQYAIDELAKLQKSLSGQEKYKSISLWLRLSFYETKVFYYYRKRIFSEIKDLDEKIRKEKLVEEVEQYSVAHGQQFLTSRKELMTLYFGVLLMEGGYYNEGIHWLNKLAAIKGHVDKSGARFFSKLILIIAYFDIKNTDMFLHNVLHFTRIINKAKAQYPFERKFISSLVKAFKASTAKDKEAIYLKMGKDIMEYSAIKAHNQSFRYFDFEDWIESKLKRKPMAEVLAARPYGRK